MEKALLYAVVAVVALLGISQVGSAMSRQYTLLECKWSGKTICIIEDPNQKKL